MLPQLRSSLGLKITLIIIVALGFLLLATIFITSRNVRNLTAQTGQQRALQEANVVQTQLLQVQQELLAASKFLSRTPGLAEAVSNRNASQARTAFLIGAAPLDLHDIDIVDHEGERLLTVVEEGDEFDEEQEDELLELALIGSEVTDLIVEGDDETEVEVRLAAALPFYDQEGTLLGGLLTSREVDDSFLAELNFQREDIRLLLIVDELILAYSWESETEMVKTADLDPTALAAATNGQTASRAQPIMLNDKPFVAAYLPLELREQTKATLVVLVEQSENLAFQTRLQRNFLALSLLITLLTIAGMLLFVRQVITQPLNQLGNVAQQMTAGNLDARATIRSTDEIGMLATGFNEMASQLQETLNTLEKRVAERTADLASTNQQLQREITHRIGIEEDLIRSRDVAIQANRLKAELLANVSHELRTPLNAIRGFAEIIHEEIIGPVTPRQQESLGKIIASTTYLTAIVGDLLSQAQLESGKLQLEISSFNPQPLIMEVVAHMQPMATTKGLDLTAVMAPSLPTTITTDPVRLRQILTNLVSNAIKFTEAGQVQITAHNGENGRWSLTVQDTGSGIPQDAQTHIFEPFRQLDGSTRRRHDGTGLGLSIVQQLVALMGGTITVKSELNQGSSFTITLPQTTNLPQQQGFVSK